MEKQRAVNTVTANDEYSQNLMKMYENWMDGDTFQGSYKGEPVKEEGIPTGQKQGGGDSGAFTTAIGSLPAVELDTSTSIPEELFSLSFNNIVLFKETSLLSTKSGFNTLKTVLVFKILKTFLVAYIDKGWLSRKFNKPAI